MYIVFPPPGKPFALWSRELPPTAPAHCGSGWGTLGPAFTGVLQLETCLSTGPAATVLVVGPLRLAADLFMPGLLYRWAAGCQVELGYCCLQLLAAQMLAHQASQDWLLPQGRGDRL